MLSPDNRSGEKKSGTAAPERRQAVPLYHSPMLLSSSEGAGLVVVGEILQPELRVGQSGDLNGEKREAGHRQVAPRGV